MLTARIDTYTNQNINNMSSDPINNLSITKSNDEVTAVVGIGASAGGLEALQILLQHLPNTTGACFLVVQHLSPDYKSMMAELLRKHTRMPLEEIQDNDRIECNKIYLLPAKKDLTISNGCLLLTDKPSKVSVNHTIDKFFLTLANDQSEKAIGIILSGTGSDGSAGLKRLKESGALTIAQTPESAKFDGMPNSAIRTGIVDLVLAPDKIGPQLELFINQPLLGKSDRQLSPEQEEHRVLIEQIFKLLLERTHVDFEKYKKSTILRRIQRRMKVRCVDSLSDYLALLIREGPELDLLAQDFLLGVTEFFRDQQAFDVIRREVIPDLISQANKDSTLRVWVTACSTGEEVYSLAILIKEALAHQNTSLPVKIFGTDINPRAIEFASDGVYSAQIETSVPIEFLSKYFSRIDDGNYRICAEIRNMIVFATHDLLKDPPFSKVSLVTCRNVLIYIRSEYQQRILNSLYFALNKNGVLFMGTSENIGELSERFEAIDSRHRIFRKVSDEKVSVPSIESSIEAAGLRRESSIPSVESLLRNYRQPTLKQNAGFANDTLIQTFVSPCILLDSELTALHVYGDVSPFVKQLAPGRISTSIKDMINEDISIALVSAATKAQKSRKPVRFSQLETQFQGETVQFDLHVLYFKEHDIASLPGYYWVLFDKLDIQTASVSEKVNVDELAKQRIYELEQALKANKEHLQVTVEELETTNEELQSANEELMSANEELQSTNEELQSVNEELYTVNTEYQEKLEEVSRANGDLDRVLRLSEIGIIFLDSTLSIRRYTDAVKKHVNLLKSDIGRPLYHISNNIPYPRLMDDVSSVLQTGESREREVVLYNRSILRIAIYPYDDINISGGRGIAITFNDITMAKYAKKGLLQTYKVLQDTIKSLTDTEIAQQKSRQLSVLAIDDNENYLDILCHKLARIKDYTVKTQTSLSLSDALTKIKQSKPDVCLIDFYLNETTAIEFIELLNEQNISIPVIVISAKADDQLIPLLLSHGLLELIEKDDITPALLRESIINALKRHQLTSNVNR